MVEITAEEQNKRKIMKRIDDSLRDFWNNIKNTNIQVIGVSEEEEEKKGIEEIYKEIRFENFHSQSSPRNIESTQHNFMLDTC